MEGFGFCVDTATRYVGLVVVVTAGVSSIDGTTESFGQQTPGTNNSLKHIDSRKLTKLSKSCGQFRKSSQTPSSPSGVVQTLASCLSSAVVILVIGASGNTFGNAFLTKGAILSVTFLPKTFLLIV